MPPKEEEKPKKDPATIPPQLQANLFSRIANFFVNLFFRRSQPPPRALPTGIQNDPQPQTADAYSDLVAENAYPFQPQAADTPTLTVNHPYSADTNSMQSAYNIPTEDSIMQQVHTNITRGGVQPQ